MTVETGFRDNRLPRHLVDAVMEGPPRPQTSREHIKRIRLTCIDAILLRACAIASAAVI